MAFATSSAKALLSWAGLSLGGKYVKNFHSVGAWAYPVVANGRLYVRDMGVLWCYDIKAPASASVRDE